MGGANSSPPARRRSGCAGAPCSPRSGPGTWPRRIRSSSKTIVTPDHNHHGADGEGERIVAVLELADHVVQHQPGDDAQQNGPRKSRTRVGPATAASSRRCCRAACRPRCAATPYSMRARRVVQRATSASTVAVSGPPARHSHSTSTVAAGAVAEPMAPSTMPNARAWRMSPRGEPGDQRCERAHQHKKRPAPSARRMMKNCRPYFLKTSSFSLAADHEPDDAQRKEVEGPQRVERVGGDHSDARPAPGSAR